MSTVLPKHLMTEEDIKPRYITPALTKKWNIFKVTMETQITDGEINLNSSIRVYPHPSRREEDNNNRWLKWHEKDEDVRRQYICKAEKQSEIIRHGG